MVTPFNGHEYTAGRLAGEADAENMNDPRDLSGCDRDFRSGYNAGYDNWFVDPCDNRAERYATSNAYDR